MEGACLTQDLQVPLRLNRFNPLTQCQLSLHTRPMAFKTASLRTSSWHDKLHKCLFQSAFVKAEALKVPLQLKTTEINAAFLSSLSLPDYLSPDCCLNRMELAGRNKISTGIVLVREAEVKKYDYQSVYWNPSVQNYSMHAETTKNSES